MMAAPIAVAQPATDPVGVELDYEAFEGCPERDAFAKNLDARRRGAVGTRGAVRLEVRLRRAADGGAENPNRAEGSLVVRSSSGAPSARRIVASTCGEAADALALIAALALQGIEVEELSAGDAGERPAGKGARRADKPRASEPERADDAPSQDPSAAGTAAEPEPTTTTATASETASGAEPEREPDAKRATEREVASAGDDEARDEGAESERAAERSSRVYLLLTGGVASGVMPDLQPLPELAVIGEHGAPGVLTLSAQAAFRISPDQTRHFEQGVVTFSWWTGQAGLCLGARGALLSASGCAALEVGALSGGATDTERPRNERRAWVALGPGVTAAYDLTPVLRLQLRAELLTPLIRYSLELPKGTVVHEPGVLGLRAGLGVGLRL